MPRSFAIEAFDRPSASMCRISAWLAVIVIFSLDATNDFSNFPVFSIDSSMASNRFEIVLISDFTI